MKYSQREDDNKFRLLNILADSITDMVGVHDLDGKLIYASPSIEKVLGWKIKGLLGRTVFDKVHPDDMAKVIKVFQSFVKTKKDTVHEWRLKTKSGDYLWVEASGRIAKDERTGKPIYAVVCARNITKRKEMEGILRNSEQKYRDILDKSPDAILIRNKNGNIVDANLQAIKLFGYSKKELIGQHVSKIYTPDEFKRVKEAIKRADRYGKAHLYDIYVLRKDGQKINVDASGSHFAVGNEVLHKIIYRDMTEQRKLQDQLRKAKVELEARIVERTMELMEANTALKVLMSHREKDKAENEEKLLTNIQGQVLPYVYELMKGPLNTKQKDDLKMLEKNLQNVMSVSLTLPPSNASQFTPKEIQVASLIKEGLSTKDIARLMSISRKTVDIFRYNIRKKLGLNNRKTNLRTHLMSL